MLDNLSDLEIIGIGFFCCVIGSIAEKLWDFLKKKKKLV